MKLRYRRLRLELGFTWAIARNSSDYKDNFVLSLEEDGTEGWGEAAPNIRYNEEPDRIEQQLVLLAREERTGASWAQLVQDADLPTCLSFALDAALQMQQAAALRMPMASHLGVPALASTYPVSFTLPILPPDQIHAFFERHDLARFPFLKMKVGRQSQHESVAELGRLYTGPVLIDGNEAYSTLEELDRHVEYWQRHVLIAGLEQPFPSMQPQLSKEAKNRYAFPLLADESVTYGVDMELIAQSFSAVNIKLQKSGSYAEALRQKGEAHRLGLGLMVGCMVETSIGIWHGLHLAAGADFVDLDSMLYLRHEPAGWVTEEAGHLKPASHPSTDIDQMAT